MEVTAEERRVYRTAARQAEEMTDEALSCRAGNHSFTVPVTAAKRRGGWETRMACRNKCGCERYQQLDTLGIVVKSSIRYPRGYLLKGVGRLTGYGKGAMRVANLSRIIDQYEFAPDEDA